MKIHERGPEIPGELPCVHWDVMISLIGPCLILAAQSVCATAERGLYI